ncbi:MAG: Mur ligase family protein, partial [Gammaproteobacteria bacterium]|nr:Mur ligase family protein [Gammaproteobacteria bacterium]
MSGHASAEGISLRELFAGIEFRAGSEVPDISVTDISANSGLVEAGGLFLACRGFSRHGLEFLDEALDVGVGAVAWEPEEGFAEPQLPAGVAGLCVPQLGDRVGIIADRFFGTPSAELAVTGITGTNGKTTTAWLVTNALLGTGVQAGYMGTLGFGIGQNLESSALTTPGCIAVHRRLRKLADFGATAVAMEVSSHGLDQGRIDGVKLRTAAFTNLSRDHLDYHGSLEAYKAAKARLFEVAGLETAVINIGDPFGAELVGKQPKP